MIPRMLVDGGSDFTPATKVNDASPINPATGSGNAVSAPAVTPTVTPNDQSDKFDDTNLLKQAHLKHTAASVTAQYSSSTGTETKTDPTQDKPVVPTVDPNYVDPRVSDFKTAMAKPGFDRNNLTPILFPNTDLKQGDWTPDCFVVAPIADLLKSPDGIQKASQMIKLGPDNNFIVTFPDHPDTPITVGLDELNDPQEAHSKGLGPAILERAYVDSQIDFSDDKDAMRYYQRETRLHKDPIVNDVVNAPWADGNKAKYHSDPTMMTLDNKDCYLLTNTPDYADPNFKGELDTVLAKVKNGEGMATVGASAEYIEKGDTSTNKQIDHDYVLQVDKNTGDILLENPWDTSTIIHRYTESQFIADFPAQVYYQDLTKNNTNQTPQDIWGMAS